MWAHCCRDAKRGRSDACGIARRETREQRCCGRRVRVKLGTRGVEAVKERLEKDVLV